MKKKVLIPAAISLMAAIVLYGAGVFMTWESNPKHWDSFGRGIYAMIVISVSCAIIGAFNDSPN